MTLLGKIFTVLIFIMSIVFMSFAVAVFATHRNWKAVVMNPQAAAGQPLGLRYQLDQLTEINKELRVQLDQLQSALAMERAARVGALAGLESRLLQLQDQLTEKEQDLAQLLATHNTAMQTLDSTQASMTALTEQNTGLRQDVRTAIDDRDDKFKQVVKLTDEIHQMRGVEQRLVERRGQLISQLSDMKKVMDKHGLTPETPVVDIPPNLDGVITAVGEDKYVEVSLGSDDGLRVGHQLEISRNGQYMGRLVVVKTSPDRSVAEILKEFQKGLIQRGDRVDTKTD